MRGSQSPMTLTEALAALEERGNPKEREFKEKRGATGPQFGVKMGDIRAVAKSIKTDHALGLELWDTGNLDARFLATLVLQPSRLSVEELERMQTSITYDNLADWLNSYVVKMHPDREAWRERWMASPEPMLARAGWSLTNERIIKDPEGLDLPALLDRIEREMGTASAAAQWTMNFCLGEIGIRFPEHRERAVQIGEKFGLYKDWKVSKGCTPPYVPTWVAAMAARQS